MNIHCLITKNKTCIDHASLISSGSPELQKFRKENHLMLMADNSLIWKSLPFQLGLSRSCFILGWATAWSPQRHTRHGGGRGIWGQVGPKAHETALLQASLGAVLTRGKFRWELNSWRPVGSVSQACQWSDPVPQKYTEKVFKYAGCSRLGCQDPSFWLEDRMSPTPRESGVLHKLTMWARAHWVRIPLHRLKGMGGANGT